MYNIKNNTKIIINEEITNCQAANNEITKKNFHHCICLMSTWKVNTSSLINLLAGNFFFNLIFLLSLTSYVHK